MRGPVCRSGCKGQVGEARRASGEAGAAPKMVVFGDDPVSIPRVLEMFPECSEQSSQKASRREVWGSKVAWMFNK